MASITTTIISIISAVCCCYMARELDKKGYVAFFIGLIFSLPGLLGYWIYFRIKLRSLRPG